MGNFESQKSENIFKHCGYIQWLNNINIACFIFRSINYAIIMGEKIELFPPVLRKHCMEIDWLMFSIIFRIIIIILYLTKL